MPPHEVNIKRRIQLNIYCFSAALAVFVSSFFAGDFLVAVFFGADFLALVDLALTGFLTLVFFGVVAVVFLAVAAFFVAVFFAVVFLIDPSLFAFVTF